MSIPEDIKDVKSVDEFSKPEFDHVKFIRTDKVFGNPTTGEAGVVDVLINAKKDVLDGLDVLVMVDSITHAVVAYSDLYPFDATLEGSGYKASVGNPFVSWWYHAAQQFTKGSLTLLTTNLDKPRSKTDLINDTALAAGDYHIYLSSEAFYTRDDKHRIITSVDPVLSNQRVVNNFPQIRINKSGDQYIVPDGASTRDRILLHAHNWDSTLWD
jgi:transcription termination factor Rho